MPAVSVILPTHDRPATVGRAVASVLAQTFTDLEVVLVDNNQATPPVTAHLDLRPLLADPRVQVVAAPEARNAAGARNRGLGAARGAWITFLDDDDVYTSEKIARQHALAVATGHPLVLCGYELTWPDRPSRLRQVHRAEFVGDAILTEALLGAPALFHRRDDTLRFDVSLDAGEDMPYALTFIRRHGLHSLPCVAQPLIQVAQQPRGGSVHLDKEAVWRAYRRALAIAHPHFSAPACRAFLARGRLERALGGYGGFRYFLRSVLGVLRTPTPRKWRLAAHAVRAQLA